MIVLPSERSQYHTSKVDKDFITAIKASSLLTTKKVLVNLSSSCERKKKQENLQILFTTKSLNLFIEKYTSLLMVFFQLRSRKNRKQKLGVVLLRVRVSNAI